MTNPPPPPELDPLLLDNPAFAQACRPFVDAGVLREDAARLLDRVAPRYGEARPDVLLALALVLEAEERGHGALDLRRAAELLITRETAPPVPPAVEPAPDRTGGGTDDEPSEADVEQAPAETPPPRPADLPWDTVILAPVQTSPLVGAWEDAATPFVALPSDGAPWLLSRRFADEQCRIAEALAALATSAPPAPVLPHERLDDVVNRFYANQPTSQGAAALRACLSGRLAVITGGPGTGKTFTVLRVLAALLSEQPTLRVALAAPTGKASVRMLEALSEDLGRLVAELSLDAAVSTALGKLKPTTVHKLLRIRPDSGASRYSEENPLPADVVLVDEASMLDFTLMRKLLDALGPHTRLVLLGDRDQLASVEAGTVLADIVAGALSGATDALARRVVFFTRSYRFRDGPLVAAFASRVQSRPGEGADTPAHRARLVEAASLLRGAHPTQADTIVDEAWSEAKKEALAAGPAAPVPTRGDPAALRWSPLSDDQRPPPSLIDELAAPYVSAEGHLGKLMGVVPDDAVAREALDALDRYRILCTHRAGPRGVAGINRAVSQRVRDAATRAWARAHGRTSLPARGGLWVGLPVLITENAYDVGLFNGDIGLVVPASSGGVELVFPRGQSEIQRVRIERLPPWMPAFALTVHKSQGSQFARVALVLAERRSPIETRELIYTGVTRARVGVHLVGSAEGLDAALARPVGRMSALRTFLRRSGVG